MGLLHADTQLRKEKQKNKKISEFFIFHIWDDTDNKQRSRLYIRMQGQVIYKKKHRNVNF